MKTKRTTWAATLPLFVLTIVTLVAVVSNNAFASANHPIRPSLTNPSANAPYSVTLFSDDFSGDLSQWSNPVGSWSINANDQLVGHGSGGGIDGWIYAGNTNWTDYSLQTMVLFDDYNAELIVRSTGHCQNEYRISLWQYRPGYFYSNMYQFSKFQNGVSTVFTDGNVPSPILITNPSIAKVEVVGNEIALYVNSQFVARVTDPNPLTSGRIGLGVVWSYWNRFDDVLVTGRQESFISGRVTDGGGQPLADVTISAGAAGSAITDAGGAYTVSALAAGTYSITPSKSGYTFSPASRTVTMPPDVTGQDFIGTSCIAPSGLNVCKLQAGDILLKTGPTFGTCGSLYRAAFALGGTYFTHSALYLGRVAAPGGSPDDVRPRIAEAQGYLANRADEVWETWLADTQFGTGQCVTDWVVVRPSASTSAIVGAVAYARQKAAEAGVVFDMNATKSDPNRFYCSKLVWKSYLDGSPNGPNLEADRGLGNVLFSRNYVTPDDLYYSSPVVQEKPISSGQARRRGFFYIWSPGHLTLIDPLGRRTGYNPATGNVFNEIPDAAYFAPPGVEAETIAVAGTGSGWQLVVTGFETGDYGLESGYADQGTRRQLLVGTTYPGKAEIYPVRDPVHATFLPTVLRAP